MVVSAENHHFCYFFDMFKLETVHRFIESERRINVMHICDYGD